MKHICIIILRLGSESSRPHLSPCVLFCYNAKLYIVVPGPGIPNLFLILCQQTDQINHYIPVKVYLEDFFKHLISSERKKYHIFHMPLQIFGSMMLCLEDERKRGEILQQNVYK